MSDNNKAFAKALATVITGIVASVLQHKFLIELSIETKIGIDTVIGIGIVFIMKKLKISFNEETLPAAQLQNSYMQGVLDTIAETSNAIPTNYTIDVANQTVTATPKDETPETPVVE